MECPSLGTDLKAPYLFIIENKKTESGYDLFPCTEGKALERKELLKLKGQC